MKAKYRRGIKRLRLTPLEKKMTLEALARQVVYQPEQSIIEEDPLDRLERDLRALLRRVSTVRASRQASQRNL